jgi:hypothetical protein
MKYSLFTYFLLCVCLLAIHACTTKTDVYTTNFAVQYANGKSIDVTRTDNIDHIVGIYSGKEYRQDHTFNYSFIINPGEHKWNGISKQIPQKLLFVKDDIYLVVLGEKVKIDTTDPQAIPQVLSTLLYFKNNDDRFLFNWFGEQKFVPVDSTNYADQLKVGTEERIPYQ